MEGICMKLFEVVKDKYLRRRWTPYHLHVVYVPVVKNKFSGQSGARIKPLWVRSRRPLCRSAAAFKSILKDETDIGNGVHNKQTNISDKNKKKVRKPEEEWIRVENTHEPIISQEVFEQVQQ